VPAWAGRCWRGVTADATESRLYPPPAVAAGNAVVARRDGVAPRAAPGRSDAGGRCGRGIAPFTPTVTAIPSSRRRLKTGATGAEDRARFLGLGRDHPGGRAHPQQGFRACAGILRLAKTYGSERLEAPCSPLDPRALVQLSSVNSILKRSLDQRACHARCRAGHHARQYSAPLTAIEEMTNDGMAQAVVELETQEEVRNLAHLEWLALLLDRDVAYCSTRRFQTRLRSARLPLDVRQVGTSCLRRRP
jgi:hypothetical protein